MQRLYTPMVIRELSSNQKTLATLDVLVRVSIAEAKYHDQTASWGGTGSHGLHFIIIVHH